MAIGNEILQEKTNEMPGWKKKNNKIIINENLSATNSDKGKGIITYTIFENNNQH